LAATLILASRSPRRRSLLRHAGFILDIAIAQIDELETPHLSLRELTIANASRKARVIAQERRDAVVLAADTLVALEGEIIGKPYHLSEAREILHRLSDRVHDVCTGVFIIAGPQRKFASFAEISRVRFRKLNNQAIDDYFRKVNPLDKAGAYAAQGVGGEIIASVEGSFSNVVGLPIEPTIEALAQFGIYPRRR
jgi:septum formation protein